MSGNRQYFIIKPLNSSPDGFGHNSGLSQIKFSLSNQNKTVESLRVVGTLYSTNGAGDESGKVNGVTETYDYNTPRKAGLNGLFSSVTISSKQGSVIERVNNLHRLSASINTCLNTQNDMDCDLMGWAVNRVSVVQKLGLVGQPFMLNLPMGLLNSGMDVLDLSDSGFAGLSLTLALNTDQTIYSGDDADDNKPYVLLKDVALVGVWRDIVDNSKGRIIPFNTYSSFFNVLNSSNESVSTTLGLSNVTGMFGNFLATASASNYTTECDNLDQLNNLAKVGFGKGGRMRPNSYRLTPVPRPDDAGTQNQILRQYNSSLKPFNDLRHSCVNLNSSVLANNGRNEGIGCRYTTTGGAGESFQNSVFQITLESDLGVDTSVPTGFYSFFVSQNVVGVRAGQVAVES